MLVNWPDRPEFLQDVLQAIIKELQNPETNKYRLAKILSRIYPHDPSDYRLRSFYLRLRYFCWLYLQGSRWIRHVEKSSPEETFSPPKCIVSRVIPTVWNQPTTHYAPLLRWLLVAHFG